MSKNNDKHKNLKENNSTDISELKQEAKKILTDSKLSNIRIPPSSLSATQNKLNKQRTERKIIKALMTEDGEKEQESFDKNTKADLSSELSKARKNEENAKIEEEQAKKDLRKTYRKALIQEGKHAFTKYRPHLTTQSRQEKTKKAEEKLKKAQEKLQNADLRHEEAAERIKKEEKRIKKIKKAKTKKESFWDTPSRVYSALGGIPKEVKQNYKDVQERYKGTNKGKWDKNSSNLAFENPNFTAHFDKNGKADGLDIKKPIEKPFTIVIKDKKGNPREAVSVDINGNVVGYKSWDSKGRESDVVAKNSAFDKNFLSTELRKGQEALKTVQQQNNNSIPPVVNHPNVSLDNNPVPPVINQEVPTGNNEPPMSDSDAKEQEQRDLDQKLKMREKQIEQAERVTELLKNPVKNKDELVNYAEKNQDTNVITHLIKAKAITDTELSDITLNFNPEELKAISNYKAALKQEENSERQKKLNETKQINVWLENPKTHKDKLLDYAKKNKESGILESLIKDKILTKQELADVVSDFTPKELANTTNYIQGLNKKSGITKTQQVISDTVTQPELTNALTTSYNTYTTEAGNETAPNKKKVSFEEFKKESKTETQDTEKANNNYPSISKLSQDHGQSQR